MLALRGDDRLAWANQDGSDACLIDHLARLGPRAASGNVSASFRLQSLLQALGIER